jgi:hypothetical protein
LEQGATEIVSGEARDETEGDGTELEDSSGEKVEGTGVVAKLRSGESDEVAETSESSNGKNSDTTIVIETESGNLYQSQITGSRRGRHCIRHDFYSFSNVREL